LPSAAGLRESVKQAKLVRPQQIGQERLLSVGGSSSSGARADDTCIISRVSAHLRIGINAQHGVRCIVSQEALHSFNRVLELFV
jgi:hypothetical protein